MYKNAGAPVQANTVRNRSLKQENSSAFHDKEREKRKCAQDFLKKKRQSNEHNFPTNYIQNQTKRKITLNIFLAKDDKSF